MPFQKNCLKKLSEMYLFQRENTALLPQHYYFFFFFLVLFDLTRPPKIFWWDSTSFLVLPHPVYTAVLETKRKQKQERAGRHPSIILKAEKQYFSTRW